MKHPGDVSELETMILAAVIDPSEIIAVIGKTEGNGGVNDFTRGYFIDRLMTMLASHLPFSASELMGRIPCALSGGTEGVLTPHYMVFCRSTDASSGGNTKALAIGTAFSEPLAPQTIGTKAHAQIVARAVRAAIVDAEIENLDDVQFVQVKSPCLNADKISALSRELVEHGVGVTMTSSRSMALARAASSFGIAAGLGEIADDEIDEASFLNDFSIHCDRASVSAGVEVECCEVVVLGMSAAWTGDLAIARRTMADAIDIAAIEDVLADLGLTGKGRSRDLIKGILVKAEPDRSSRIRGERHTMLGDTDIDAQRHIRGAVGGLVAGVTGSTRIFVSGGAEHQGPDGGGLVAVIAMVTPEDLCP